MYLRAWELKYAYSRMDMAPGAGGRGNKEVEGGKRVG